MFASGRRNIYVSIICIFFLIICITGAKCEKRASQIVNNHKKFPMRPQRILYSYYFLNFSPDGKLLASVPSTFLWDWKNGKIVQDFRKENFVILKIAFSPDNKYYAVSGEQVALFEHNSHKRIFKHAGDNAIFSPDSRYLIFINGKDNSEKEILRFDLDKRRITGRIPHPLPPTEELMIKPFETSLDSSLFISGKLKSNYIIIRDSKSLMQIHKIQLKEDFCIDKIYTGKNRILIRGYGWIAILTFDRKSKFDSIPHDKNEMNPRIEYLDNTNIKKNYVSCVTISQDGNLLSKKQYDNIERKHYISIWDIDNNKMISKIYEKRPTGTVTMCMAISPDNKILAAGSCYGKPNSGDIRLYDIKSGKLIRILNPDTQQKNKN